MQGPGGKHVGGRRSCLNGPEKLRQSRVYVAVMVWRAVGAGSACEGGLPVWSSSVRRSLRGASPAEITAGPEVFLGAASRSYATFSGGNIYTGDSCWFLILFRSPRRSDRKIQTFSISPFFLYQGE